MRRVYFAERERRREPYAGIDVVRDSTPGADHEFLSHDLRRARGTMALTAREIVRRTVEAVT
ncbi:MAG: hypothetical protein ACXWDM_02205 [Nocardioides sp.]